MHKNDLVHGSIFQSIISFSIPLLFGNLFQQLYNTVNSYVLGNYVGKDALAAVGATSPVINLLIGFFMGLATGAGVIIAQHYGASDQKKLQKAIDASIIVTIVMSIVLTFAGIFLTKYIQIAIGIPEDIFGLSQTYLHIYFAGITFTLIYNMGSGILRAMGDSKRPLVFLIISSVLNMILVFIFVKYWHLGVVGAGFSMMIAQGVSALLTLGVLRKEKYVSFHLDLDMKILKQIIVVGFPTGLQNSIMALSNLMAQSYINSYGSIALAGYSAQVSIDTLIQLPTQSFNLAITTFVGQNYGAKQYERVKKGTRFTMIISIGLTVLLAFVTLIWGENLLAIFNSDVLVIEAGRIIQIVFIPFYIFIAINQVISGVLRGVGKSSVPMYIMGFHYVIVRQVYLWISAKVVRNIAVVYAAWPLSWLTCALTFIIYYYRVQWLKEDKS